MKTKSWQRTAKYFRGIGYRVEKTEYHFRGRRHDLMGFVDGIAFGVGHTIYIQACGRDWSEHVRKMTGECGPALRDTLVAGNHVWLIGWRKLKKTGWTPRIRKFTLADIQSA